MIARLAPRHLLLLLLVLLLGLSDVEQEHEEE